MSAYYNEYDKFAAQLLRELINAGLIAPGEVDERSICDVRPDDLRGFTQCHFFAGIGVWSYALRRAGWDDSRPVWTGSCPCQPFSNAGQRKGINDERHLWPVFRDLIAECRPATVFGEQVASADGRTWLDAVRADVEALGFAFGAADLCAAGVGAPHIRQRLFWVADAECRTTERHGQPLGGTPEGSRGEVWERSQRVRNDAGNGCVIGRMAYAGSAGSPEQRRGRYKPARSSEAGSVGGFWDGAEWVYCRDEKWRPTEPGTFPLVDESPARVGRLRCYGNAVVAEVAETFIEATGIV